MKNRYTGALIIISSLLVLALTVQTSYSFYEVEEKDTNVAVNEDCISIMYSDEKNINLVNPSSYTDSDGMRLSTKTISITNTCNSKKEVQLILNIKDSTTIDLSKLKINVTGTNEVETTLISALRNLETTSSYKESKQVAKITLNSGESARLNMRIWLSEDNVLTDGQNRLDVDYLATSELVQERNRVAEKVLDDNSLIETPNYEIEETGLFKVDTSYYFRGNPENNYFELGDTTWRIVAINADNTVKLANTTNSIKTSFQSSSTSVVSAAFDTSTIKETLENWYTENLTNYESYLVDTTTCTDSSYTTYGSKIIYGALSRVYDATTPSLTCNTGDKEFGGETTSKIGLLSADEAVITGAKAHEQRTNYYLYTGYPYYLSSPFYYLWGSSMFILNENGELCYTKGSNVIGTVPVITLKAETTIKGTGTLEDPYQIEIN